MGTCVVSWEPAGGGARRCEDQAPPPEGRGGVTGAKGKRGKALEVMWLSRCLPGILRTSNMLVGRVQDKVKAADLY